MKISTQNKIPESNLVADIKHLIIDTKQRVANVANAGITMLYWHIGERINRDVLGNQRAEYGKQIIATLAQQLKAEFGRGYDEKSLRRMMQFATLFPDKQIVAPLATQLSWSHFVEVMPLKDEIQREFYLTMASEERWTKRTLRAKIDGMLFERTAISSKPEDLIRTELASLRNERKLSPDMVFKSPYFLEFTGLSGNYSEESLESTLITHIEQFLLELGDGDRRGNIVAQYHVHPGLNQLSGFHPLQSGGPGQNFLRHSHSHGSMLPPHSVSLVFSMTSPLPKECKL